MAPVRCRLGRPQSLLRHALALRGSLLGHTTVQLGAKVCTAIALVLAYMIVGGAGSDRLVADFSLSMAAAGLVATFVDAGVGLWAVRIVAEGRAVPRMLAARVVTAALSLVGVSLAAAAGVIPGSAAPWVVVAGVASGCGGLWRGVLWGCLKHETESVLAVVQATVMLVGLAAAVQIGGLGSASCMIVVAGAYVVGYAGRFLIGRRLVRRETGQMSLRAWFSNVYSYAGQSLVQSAQMQADVLLLGFLWVGPVAGVAAYGLSMRFYYAVGMPFESLAVAVLPRVARSTTIHWRRVVPWSSASGVLLVIALLAACSLGSAFGLSEEASAYLHTLGWILAVGLPFRFTAYILGAIVTGRGRQSLRFAASAVGLCTMLLLDCLLIPRFGPYGAALALVVADATLTLGYVYAAQSPRPHVGTVRPEQREAD